MPEVHVMWRIANKSIGTGIKFSYLAKRLGIYEEECRESAKLSLLKRGVGEMMRRLIYQPLKGLTTNEKSYFSCY